MSDFDVTMEIHRDVPRHFMSRYERYEPVIKDHTSIMTYKTCPRKYFYQIVLGRVAKEEAIYFAWGSAYHRFREILEKAYGLDRKGLDQTLAVDAYTEAVNAGMKVWRERGKDQAVGTQFEFMTAARLLSSFQVAFQHWSREKQQNRVQVLAVEQLFNVRLPNGESTSGRADQIVRWNGQLWGRDFKTTSKDEKFYNRTIDPNDQFTRYTYAEAELCGEPIQGQLIEVLYNGKSTKTQQKGPDIFTLIASRTDQQIKRWVDEEIFWRETINRSRDQDMYPMVENACAFCPYHSVCTKPSEASMMAQLESFFVVRPWDNARVGVTD